MAQIRDDEYCVTYGCCVNALAAIGFTDWKIRRFIIDLWKDERHVATLPCRCSPFPGLGSIVFR